MRVAVLVPKYDGEPGRPQDRPIGRAALELERQGIEVVFADRAYDGRMFGMRATTDGWVEVENVAVAAAYDRFPSQSRPEAYARLTDGLGELPVANPRALVELCRDKVATQRLLEAAGVPMPDQEDDPERFETTLKRWGHAYLKPRYGAFGRGVSKVEPGDPLPATGVGSVAGVLEPLFLQRAVPAPEGYRGIALRILCQRVEGDLWTTAPAVARWSKHDDVVNAARGAEVVVANDLVPGAVAPLTSLALRVCDVLAAQPTGELLLELGIDAMVGAYGLPHLIEVNGRPRGRLEALAALDPSEWEARHVRVCMQPLLYLASRFG